jgi:hypothetical protein
MDPKPSHPSGGNPECAAPPKPVDGAPTGVGGSVVVDGVATGKVVVVGARLVVVLGTVVVVVVLATDVVVVATVVVVPDVAEHVGVVIVPVSMVTAPVWARTRPLTDAPVVRVTDVKARIVPANWLFVPRVAELVTCQNTLHADAPFSSTTLLPAAVVSAELTWMMKTEPASPAPLSVSVPVRARLDGAWYTPATRVAPPRSAPIDVAGVRPRASRYAAVLAACAEAASVLATSVVPELCTPGGKPVTEVPGDKPMSPEMTDDPVLVTVVPARTAKGAALERLTGDVAADAGPASKAAPIPKASSPTAPVVSHDREMMGRRRVDNRVSGCGRVDLQGAATWLCNAAFRPVMSPTPSLRQGECPHG